MILALLKKYLMSQLGTHFESRGVLVQAGAEQQVVT